MGLGMVAHSLNLSTRRQRQADVREFKASLVYLVSSRLARAMYSTETLSQKKQAKGEERERKKDRQTFSVFACIEYSLFQIILYKLILHQQ